MNRVLENVCNAEGWIPPKNEFGHKPTPQCKLWQYVFMVRNKAICFVIYANSLGQKFLLLHFVLFENIKLLGQLISLFTA